MATEAVPKTVGDYVTLVRGTTYQGSLVGEPGPALLGLGSIEPGGGFRNGQYKTYGGACPARLTLYPGDLYVALKGATKDGKMIGSVARVPQTISSGRLTQDTVKLVPRVPDAAFADYLYWLLRSPQYRAYCAGRAMGSAVVALSRQDFLNYPVPPLTPPRRRLVGLLEMLERRIELNRRMNETLEEMARALFESWFVDFDPVRAKAEGRDPGLPAHLADLFPDRLADSELGPIPEGWRVSRVGEDFDLTMGQSPPGHTYNERGDGVPFYQGRADFGVRFPRRRVYCTEPARSARARDTLVSVRAPVGDINMASEDCAIGRGVAALRHRCGNSAYTFQFAQHLKSALVAFEGDGTVFGSIGGTDFRRILCVAPPSRGALDAFEDVCSPFDGRIATNELEVATLIGLRDAVLPRLVSGEFVLPLAEEAASTPSGS